MDYLAVMNARRLIIVEIFRRVRLLIAPFATRSAV